MQTGRNLSQQSVLLIPRSHRWSNCISAKMFNCNFIICHHRHVFIWNRIFVSSAVWFTLGFYGMVKYVWREMHNCHSGKENIECVWEDGYNEKGVSCFFMWLSSFFKSWNQTLPTHFWLLSISMCFTLKENDCIIDGIWSNSKIGCVYLIIYITL